MKRFGLVFALLLVTLSVRVEARDQAAREQEAEKKTDARTGGPLHEAAVPQTQPDQMKALFSSLTDHYVVVKPASFAAPQLNPDFLSSLDELPPDPWQSFLASERRRDGMERPQIYIFATTGVPPKPR